MPICLKYLWWCYFAYLCIYTNQKKLISYLKFNNYILEEDINKNDKL